jgi:hypothetical protein
MMPSNFSIFKFFYFYIDRKAKKNKILYVNNTHNFTKLFYEKMAVFEITGNSFLFEVLHFNVLNQKEQLDISEGTK